MKPKKLKPCLTCPFRVSNNPFPLGRERRQNIVDGLLGDSPFGCHKTTHFDESGLYDWTERERPCVGAAKLIKNERGSVAANLAFRLAIVYQKFDESAIDYSIQTLETAKDFISAED
jgi:hypothetical protein